MVEPDERMNRRFSARQVFLAVFSRPSSVILVVPNGKPGRIVRIVIRPRHDVAAAELSCCSDLLSEPCLAVPDFGCGCLLMYDYTAQILAVPYLAPLEMLDCT